MALVLTSMLIAVVMLRSLFVPIIVAAWFAALTSPLVSRLSKLLGGRRRVAALATLLLVLLVVAPTVLVAVPVWDMLVNLFERIPLATREGVVRNMLHGASTDGCNVGSACWAQRWIEVGQRYGPTVTDLAAKAFGAVGTLAVQLFAMSMSAYYFAADGERIIASIRRVSPFAPRHLERLFDEFLDVARALLVGGVLTSVAQGVVAYVIYQLVGITHPLMFAGLTAVASMIPVVGSGLVWVPLAGLLVAAGRWHNAMWLTLAGLGVISTVDNVLRPILARFGGRKLHPLLLALGVLGGLNAFGAWGLLFGPLLLAVCVTALRLYGDARDQASTA